LCAYQRRQFGEAEKRFRAIAESGVEAPETLRATYFLARSLMKTGRYEDAERLFRRIYELDAPFYDAWNCDFLLGECRRAQGKG
jgi:pentatricopeptide repeat protein